jgi:alpha-glucosidase
MFQWWQIGTVYQVYPRSFQDSNGDGIGDIDGIRQRLDYLVWLGVDAIWISPIYPSPMHDFGYDITDYCGIDPIFGSLESFDRLIGEAHQKQLKIILDFVPNHTSIVHPWFVASQRSRADPKRHWYIWRRFAITRPIQPGPGVIRKSIVSSRSTRLTSPKSMK